MDVDDLDIVPESEDEKKNSKEESSVHDKETSINFFPHCLSMEKMLQTYVLDFPVFLGLELFLGNIWGLRFGTF